MTPTIYEKIGNQLLSTRKTLWVGSVGCAIGVVASIFLEPFLGSAVAYIIFGFLLSALIITWGLLLTTYWFSSAGSFSKEAIEKLEGGSRTAKVIFSWYAAVLLTVWLASGIFIVPILF